MSINDNKLKRNVRDGEQILAVFKTASTLKSAFFPHHKDIDGC